MLQAIQVQWQWVLEVLDRTTAGKVCQLHVHTCLQRQVSSYLRYSSYHFRKEGKLCDQVEIYGFFHWDAFEMHLCTVFTASDHKNHENHEKSQIKVLTV